VTDYTKTTGVNGKLMIRDLDPTVEFWFKAGYEDNWHNDLKFSWTANGSTTTRYIDYPTGAEWKKVGSVTVNSSQTVTFRLVSDTSISGIGGPTSFSVSLNRDSKPKAPSTPTLSGITATSVTVKFTDGANGGDPIDARQIAYSTNSSTPTASTSYPTVSSDGSTTVTGLSQGTTYYFWARTHNSEGWSPWSGRASAKTLKGPAAPPAPLLSSVRATSVDVAFSPNDDGGSSIIAYQIGYGTNATTPTTTVSATSPQYVTDLTPGTVYYFRVRAQNSVGWSAWSPATSIRTVAGAYIKVGAETKLAVPYVRVGGVWKIAEPWVKNVGVWKRTT
jgi:hypothetical protein